MMKVPNEAHVGNLAVSKDWIDQLCHHQLPKSKISGTSKSEELSTKSVYVYMKRYEEVTKSEQPMLSKPKNHACEIKHI